MADVHDSSAKALRRGRRAEGGGRRQLRAPVIGLGKKLCVSVHSSNPSVLKRSINMSALKPSYGNGFFEVGPEFGFLPKSAPLRRYRINHLHALHAFVLVRDNPAAQTPSSICRAASTHGRPSRVEESRFGRAWPFSH
jgi:hypothetical protein